MATWATDFFQSLTPTVLDAATNTGSSVVSAATSNPAALVARDYELRFNGAWSLFDASTGQPLTMTGAGTLASPFSFDGLSVTVSAGAAAGDRFMIRPVADASGAFTVAQSDGGRLAAASPVFTGRSLANVSSASIAPASVDDITDPNLLQSVELRFEAPGTFRIYNSLNVDLSGPLAYTSGADITFNGWTVQISGTPVTGDRFSVQPTAAGSGDNRNALALADLPSRGYLGGGQVSLDNIAARLLSTVGAAALRNNQDLAVQSALREQAAVDLETSVGVNLDEEAANLMRYQQAYQAAGKIIGVADELFNTLLGLIR